MKKQSGVTEYLSRSAKRTLELHRFSFHLCQRSGSAASTCIVIFRLASEQTARVERNDMGMEMGYSLPSKWSLLHSNRESIIGSAGEYLFQHLEALGKDLAPVCNFIARQLLDRPDDPPGYNQQMMRNNRLQVNQNNKVGRGVRDTRCNIDLMGPEAKRPGSLS